MKVTLNWLKEFVDIDLTPQELASRLTHAGLEVEGIETLGAIAPTVITVKIEKMEKHPNADRLTLCDVNLGTERRRIVCGAKNMKEGDVVALAQPGTLLPDGKKIERSKIRDVVSDGMLCSEKELGLAEDSAGLMILPHETPLGKPLTEAVPLSDTMFEINVTPNRSDCLSILGIAREIAAVTGKPLKERKPMLPAGSFSLEKLLKVEVKDPDLCPRYTARMIRGVKIHSSPLWVQLRLKRVGVRAINNVVDATNYVMMETGQPLHAFDYKQIAEGTLRIQCKSSPPVFQSLDEVERKLLPEDLLITDTQKPLAIAGVMGGLNSGVSDSTQELVLEAAYFDPFAVRKTSKRLGLKTESSYRFERGVDPSGVKAASERLAELILAWGGGEVSKELLDVSSGDFAPKTIRLRASRLSQVLGLELKPDEAEAILSRLGLNPKKKSEDLWECVAPAYRHDLTREIDLIEEVGRIAGYQRIPEELPPADSRPARDFFKEERETKIRSFLESQGFSEVIHYSFCARKEVEACALPTQDLLELSNPLSEELAVMRPSLVPTMLRTLRYNLSRQNVHLKLFELQTVFEKRAGQSLGESKSLCFAWVGDRYGKHWGLPREKVDFFDGKGVWEGIAQVLRLPRSELNFSKAPYLHPGLSAEITVGHKKVGDIGLLHPGIAAHFEIDAPVVLGEIHLSVLLEGEARKVQYESLPRFPSIDRDLTVVVPESLEGGSVIREIEKLKIKNIRDVALFDIFRGKPIEEGKKALTYSIRYQDPEKTLTDAEVNQMHAQLVDQLKTSLPIEWR